jgi:hypothetical protein
VAYFGQYPILRVAHFAFGAHCSVMGQSFGNGIHLVEVTTDDLFSRCSKEPALGRCGQTRSGRRVGLEAVPEGWSAALADGQIKPEEAAVLKMQPGDVRELTK